MLDSLSLAHGAVALGIGMLVGMERERKKNRCQAHTAAGLRTYAIAALPGYICMLLAGTVLLGIVSFVLSLLICIAFRTHAQKDPGITSEWSIGHFLDPVGA
ncbi:MgtC/SapB family protein [Pseudomonas fluorescens]|uniref:MgtC/SapB family protein n=1 Tax=Pseudomonas fluorescens TaxID=294 RepID=UPI00177C84BF|nr:MgtC/SapB family protein [Pseudomonas fluorescens]